MSKARSRGCVRPTNSPQAPSVGTPGYLRVVGRGCGATPDYWGEVDCPHLYGWECDDCPLVYETHLDYECRFMAARVSFQGPPRNIQHPMEYWCFPAVASELHWMYSPTEIANLLARFERIGPEEVEPTPLLFSFS